MNIHAMTISEKVINLKERSVRYGGVQRRRVKGENFVIKNLM